MEKNKFAFIGSLLQQKLTIPLQLGLSTYSFPWAFGAADFVSPTPMTGEDLIRFAASQNLSHVQIGDNYPLHLLSRNERTTLRQTAEKSAVKIEVGTKRLSAENMMEYISIAKEFSSPFLRVVMDDVDFHPPEKEIVETIRSLLPVLKEAGIILAIENHDRFSAKSLVQIIQATDPELVGICLDTANSLGAGEGISEIFPLLAPFTVNLHVKDFIIRRVAHKMGFMVEGCAAGEGMLSIPSLLDELMHKGKCETATLELWSNAKATPEETIGQEARWVEKSIRYLKTIIK